MGVAHFLVFFTFIGATPLAFSKHVSSLGDSLIDDSTNLVKLLDNAQPKPYTTCETESCRQRAGELFGAMNKSVNPCDNFYEFTCGNWGQQAPMKAVVDQNIVKFRLSDILGKEVDSTDIPPVVQAKKWFRACMNTATLDSRGIKPIETVVQRGGGWPMLMGENEWNANDNPWQKLESYYASLMGRNVFFDIVTDAANEQSKNGQIFLFPPQLIEKTRRLMLHYQENYKIFTTRTVKMFARSIGSTVSDAVLNQRIQDMLQFERDVLRLITDGPDARIDWPSIPVSFQGLVNYYRTKKMRENPTSNTSINWETGIKQLFGLVHIDIEPTEPIYITSFKYFERIGSLLERTPPRTIVNFVHWNFIITMLDYAGDRTKASLGLSTNTSPRWMECVKTTEITYAFTYAFTKLYFPNSTESAGREIMKNIQKAVEADIENSNWLDETSKSLVKRKISTMKIFTGYPAWYSNGTAVTNYYKNLTIGDEHLENVLSYMGFLARRKLLANTKTGEGEFNQITPIDMSGQYLRRLNAIEVPPVIFSPLLFSPGMPDYIKYADAGFTGGHEVGHAFDDVQFHYSTYGNSLGLSEAAMNGYNQRVRCFVNQYNSYFGIPTPPENNFVSSKNNDFGTGPGAISKSENIADAVGLQATYEAYKKLKTKKRTDEPKLPGLEEYTNEQLFFITFGHKLCQRKEPGFGQLKPGDPHSQGHVRLIGVISNTKDFAKVFNCPIGSAMNPNAKCSIWEKPSVTPVMA